MLGLYGGSWGLVWGSCLGNGLICFRVGLGLTLGMTWLAVCARCAALEVSGLLRVWLSEFWSLGFWFRVKVNDQPKQRSAELSLYLGFAPHFSADFMVDGANSHHHCAICLWPSEENQVYTCAIY